MDYRELELNYKNESFYWWFVGRRRMVLSLLDRYLDRKNGLKFLDAGCGTGIMLSDMSRFGEPTGSDYSDDALEFCRKRGLKHLVKADLTQRLPFEDESFDFVTILGVLYNDAIKDDKAVFSELRRVLKKGGILISDEGAFKFLVSRHNVRVGGTRRYTTSELKQTIEASGLKMIKISYWNMFLLPMFFIAKIIDSFLPSSSRGVAGMDKPLPRPFNWFFTQLLQIETKILRFCNLPFGTSIIAVAIKD